ncbi:hypothetical protein E4U42_000711 [Claviceps africana]|uniref:Uncharacterized protein n=1 Tax=Claviceps africana TaxID=83212 RepID=A0A8K0JBC4_9HYPO|nr:hypothetical protein E4U42_000711 [Claviceps africana]
MTSTKKFQRTYISRIARLMDELLTQATEFLRQAPTANSSVNMVFQTPVRAAEFKSAYGPKYTFQPNLKGWNKTTMYRAALRSAPFGGAAVVGLLFYVSGIPRVKEDILQNIPVVGRYFVKQEIHPQDNPF